MKTLIVYATKYGCTESCANTLSKKLTGEVELINIAKEKDFDLSIYEKIVIGGSIYVGSIQKEIKDFCIENLDTLMNIKIGLFVCCMRDGEEVQEQIKNAYPEVLYSAALAKENFGGEFNFSKMGFLDKLITKKIAKVTKDTTNILYENIIKFAEILNEA